MKWNISLIRGKKLNCVSTGEGICISIKYFLSSQEWILSFWKTLFVIILKKV